MRSTQPQFGPARLDLGNQLARGLVAIPSTVDPTYFDPIGNKWAFSGSGALVRAIGPVGVGHTFTSANSQYKKAALPRPVSGAATMAAWFYVADGAANYGITSMSPSSGSNSRFQMYVSFGAFIVGVQTEAGVSANIPNAGPNPLTYGKWYFGVGRYDGANIDGWVAGDHQTIANAGTIIPVDMYVGARFNTSVGFFLNGGVEAPMFWNRALSNAEVASLIANPWQMFAQNKILKPAVSGFQPAWAMQSNQIIQSAAQL